MKLSMYRGDTAVFSVQCKQSDGTPLDITSGTLFFTSKSSTRQVDADAVFAKDSDGNGITKTDPVQGLAVITLSPSDTVGIYAPALLRYDLQFVTSGGNVFTLLAGDIMIFPDVTISTYT